MKYKNKNDALAAYIEHSLKAANAQINCTELEYQLDAANRRYEIERNEVVEAFNQFKQYIKEQHENPTQTNDTCSVSFGHYTSER